LFSNSGNTVQITGVTNFYNSNGSLYSNRSVNLSGYTLTFSGGQTIFSGGNISIGTTTDSGYKLDVSGTFRATGAATFGGSVDATSFRLGNGQYLRLTRNSGAFQYDAFGIESGTDNTRLLITNDFNIVNGSLISQFHINSTGNVGIGTTNPVITGAKNLTIEGGASTAAIGLFSSTATGNTARNWMIAVNNIVNGDMSFTQSTVKGGDPRASGIDMLYIACSGNVGIGTTNPTYKLDVSGTARFNNSVSVEGTLTVPKIQFSTIYPSLDIMTTGYENISATFCKVIRYLAENVPFEITAVHNHYGLLISYGSALKSIGSIGDGGFNKIDIVNHTSANGGSWSINRICAGFMAVCHHGGDYPGPGYYMIKMTGVYTACFMN
jgi:hypothetical protein